MREIKFRFWDQEDKEYYQISGSCPTCRSEYYLINNKGFIAEQYTERHDSNGVEVYDGDIIKQFGGIGVMIVSWHRNAFRFDKVWHMCEISDAAITVIGNIHQNPELLEVINVNAQ